MFLYLVQHAEAMSEIEDVSRSLSKNGIADIKKVAEFAAGLNIDVNQIFHSGKMRALQTAQILEERITAYMGIEKADGLAPMDDPDLWFTTLSDMNDEVMVVGHMPHLARLASLLLCGNKDKKVVNFEMGCIACLQREDNYNWLVKWMIKPGMIK